MAVMLSNVLNKLSITEKGQPIAFSDVSMNSNPWSWQAIGKIGKHGIATGFEDGSFRPKEQLSRAQMAVMLGELERTIADSTK
ncbi:MAG: S-layer homology domain-containing protein [Clostridiales Family XIII bacterium]|nr:S-layer homology domain-containing protein [Clostridiales Family XIII bacterium]